jgi:hypothetical protein
MNDFYVGYLPKAPRNLARSVLRTVLVLNGVAIMVALLLVLGQQPFVESTFEYLQDRDYSGLIVESPYPVLLTGQGSFLLVAPGKHGATELAKGFTLQNVELKGSLIRNGEDRMLELVPGSIRTAGAPVRSVEPAATLGAATLTGEIVDSKCYFGVMNPGRGKVYRGCAARCISGGIPPVFLVRDSSGNLRTLLLTGMNGRPLDREVLDFVAEPIRISGQLLRSGDTMLLQADPKTFVRVTSTRE